MTQSVMNGKKRKLIEALALGASIKDAAETVGISPRQAQRYLLDPNVKQALIEAQDQALAAVTRKVVGAMGGALDTLESIAGDRLASPNARVSAARAILENGLRFTETLTLVERIEALERRMGDETTTEAG